MGERIKNLGVIKLGSNSFVLEMNEGTKDDLFEIHIQNHKVKFSLKDKEFIKLVACFAIAEKRFKKFKELSNE